MVNDPGTGFEHDRLSMSGLNALAAMLGVDPAQLSDAIGEPWSDGQDGPGSLREFTTFTGRENPRTPGRDLIAIRVDHHDRTVEVAHAVGVPLPNGRMQWAMAEPRTSVPIDVDELAEWAAEHDRFEIDTTPAGLKAAMLAELAAGISRVAEVAMLRGTSWT